MDLMLKNNKGFAPLIILPLIALLGFGLFSIIQKQKKAALLKDPVFVQLTQKEYDRDDLIYLDAFGEWKTYSLGEFSLDLPQGNSSKFSFNQYDENKYVSETGDIKETRLASAYAYSPYYGKFREYPESAGFLNRNDVNLSGGVNIYKITKADANVSARVYVDALNKVLDADKTCENKLKVELNNAVLGKALETFHYQGGACHGPIPPPGYLVEGKNYLLKFDGGHEPLPKAVMERVLASIKFLK